MGYSYYRDYDYKNNHFAASHFSHDDDYITYVLWILYHDELIALDMSVPSLYTLRQFGRSHRSWDRQKGVCSA